MKNRSKLGRCALAAASALGIVVLAGIASPASAQSGAPTSTPDFDLQAVLANAPELAGYLVDTSGVHSNIEEIAVSNQQFLPKTTFLNADEAHHNDTDLTQSEAFSGSSWSSTATMTTTTDHTVSSSLGAGGGIAVPYPYAPVAGGLSYSYQESWGTQHTESTSRQVTVNYASSSVTTPAHSTAHHQATVVQGTFTGDAKTTARLSGNVVLDKCGKEISIPIGQLLSLTRDKGQDPLAPSWVTPNSDGTALMSRTTHFVDENYVTSYARDWITPDATPSVASQVTTNQASTPSPRALAKLAPSPAALANVSSLRYAITCDAGVLPRTQILSFDAGDANHAVVLTSAHKVVQYDGKTAKTIDTSTIPQVQVVSEGSDGELWVLAGDASGTRTPYRYDGAKWTAMGVTDWWSGLDVASQNNVVLTATSHDDWYWDGASWTHLLGQVLGTSVGVDGTIWGLGTDNHLYRLDRTSIRWVQQPNTRADNLSVGSKSHVAHISNGVVWASDSVNGATGDVTSWKCYAYDPTQLSDPAACTVAAIKDPLVTPGIVAAQIGADGVVWVVASSGIWQHTSMGWKNLTV
ncbi:toxin ETX/toxin MTX2 [Microbacterium sp. AG790]|uniref:ETX/MTX2 family pore-forming toxin n=1 Tax=Microbacterium sp. AG790 TaxID=2183995 RepID=UPI000EAC9D67|nr:ETX/MTX2 family pore-forming toxin [Microbacterium sp. AG790]RKS86705.1 toxin ETX/toxin MTX2 [Microbacterium sp. AG790]